MSFNNGATDCCSLLLLLLVLPCILSCILRQNMESWHCQVGTRKRYF